MAELGFLPGYVCVKKSGPMCSNFVDWQGSIWEIDHHDFLGHGVEHGAAQLPAVTGVARIPSRTRVNYQDPAETPHDLMVGVTIKDKIGGGFGELL
jgi:hypothetical protein